MEGDGVTEDDPYADLKRHRWPDDMPPATRRRTTASSRKRCHFIKVPVPWVERLTQAHYIATYRVALHLLYLSWKAGSQSVELPNGSLRAEGVERRAKWRALQELERLGLIAIERRLRKAPRVAVLS
jgi:hypothetical protein